MLLTSESELSSLEQMILNREILQENEVLTLENNNLKKNIK